MGNEVTIILKAVDRASGTLKGATGSMKGMLTTIGAMSGAAMAAGAAIKKIADDTVAYNKSIRELTQVTGTGAEEISRIVQVADDWGIEIGQVRTALVMMNKNGMKPSIDNLAALADEYVNTSDKTKFAEKAAKLLGRQYTTLIPLFAKGGQALRDQAAAVNDNLIATEDSIQAARDYEVALDNWNDSVQGLSMSIGMKLLPSMTALIDLMNGPSADNAAAVINQIFAGTIIESEAGKMKRGAETAATALERAAAAETAFYKRQRGESGFAELGSEAEAAAQKIDLIPVALQEVTKASFAAAAVDAVTKAFQNGLIPQSKYDEIMRKIGDKFTDLTDDEINQQILLANLARSYEEGRLPIEDYISTLDYLAIAWGKIPKNVSTTYTIHYQRVNPAAGEPGPDVPVVIPGGGNEGGGGAVTPRAGGGPVMAGMSYLVGEQGPEIFTPGKSGGITPNGAMGGDVFADITINAAPGMDENAIAAKVVMWLQNASRNNRAGGAYRGV